MKVLHVGAKTYPPRHGGVERIVYEVADGMKGVESHFFVEEKVEADIGRNVTMLKKGLLLRFRQTRKYCRREEIDIVHLHKEPLVPLAIMLQLSGVRCVWTNHGCAWRLARWAWFHRVAFWILDYIGCLVLRRVVFVGEPDRRYFQKLLPFRRLYLISNGVSCYHDDRRERCGTMVYVGRLSPEKNILSLIEAADRAQVKVDLYGPFDRRDGGYRQEVMSKLRDSHYVQWNGAVSSDVVSGTLARYSCFVNPSFSEGLPVSVLEAAAEGLCLVLSDIEQHRVLRFPVCQYINPNDIELGAIEVLACDGAQNREHVRTKYSKGQMVRAYYEMYSEMI
ncbi:hypothetical protein LCGC14_0838620 [marine sediment metagenome]|uniref:Glycosyltransferase subfamily 4-like N-terminal domain-containing protein n=1 Tax=marine sediment metagenome TaxID=412755 RepID=A0A0F9SL36_9ZZZZ